MRWQKKGKSHRSWYPKKNNDTTENPTASKKFIDKTQIHAYL